MRVVAAVLGALTLAAAGCGGREQDASEVLAETASKLGEIRSGDLSLRFVASAEAQEESGQVGFELEGPFALPEGEELPVARMQYTQIAGEEQGGGTFISTGENAYVELEGTTYELPDDQESDLRGVGGGLARGEGLGTLEIERWMEDARLSDGGEVGGAETDRISARLNVVNAVNDLLEVAGEGGNGEPIRGDTAEQLERAVESATVDVWTGKEDRLLRRIRIDVAFSAPDDLPTELRGLVGAAVELDLAIRDPNTPVRVEEPADAQPFPG